MRWWNRKKFRKDIEKRSMTCWKGERERVMSYFVIHAGKSIVCIQLLPHLIFFISLKICIICVRFVFLRLTKYGNT